MELNGTVNMQLINGLWKSNIELNRTKVHMTALLANKSVTNQNEQCTGYFGERTEHAHISGRDHVMVCEAVWSFVWPALDFYDHVRERVKLLQRL
jgi:hypothetical protein